MTRDSGSSRSKWLPIVIGLGVVVLLAAGVGLGLTLAGEETATAPSTTVAPSTTSAESADTTTSTTVVTTSTTKMTPTTTTTQAAETELTFEVSADATIDSDDADVPLGMSEFLEMEYNEPDILQSLLRFEVDGIPEGHSVIDATLRVFMVESSGGGGLISTVEGDWDEATVTWNTAPQIGLGLAPLPLGGEGTDVDIDVTGSVTGNGAVDYFLTTFSDDDYGIASKEGGHGPTLVLTVSSDPDPQPNRGFVMVGAGDIAGCDSSGDEATADILDRVVEDADEAVVFTTGDNAYEEGSAANFADCYEPSWGRHKAITRPTAGAREYRIPDAEGHFEYFGDAAGDPGEGYYSYELGGWQMLALNSICAEVGGCELDSPQGQWLQETLESSDARCTIAYWHDPVFSSTVDGGNTELLEFFGYLHDSDVEILVNGDDHFYERFVPQDASNEEFDEGLRQFTVGTGGHSLSEFGLPAPHSAVRFNQAFGVLVLTLHPNGYEWEFITEEGALFTDRGDDACH